ncbi:Acyltransferase [Trichostrongylus colubriformis]|uniref:Acyltransferase n=1 Tax=Trichostrongylus colubriformis TaxID=6319 RepID=A0AAN8FBJ6_TRICO
MIGRRASPPEYVDWLAELRKKGTFNFVSQKRDFPLNTNLSTHPRSRTNEEIKESVLTSRRVTDAIADEVIRSGESIDKVRADAAAIMTMMAHNYGLYSIRTFGYAVSTVFERIFHSIYVNSNQLKLIRELCKKNSVVFMPTHRTYLDFLLLSLFCFEYQVPLPAIAAGMDFTNSWIMSEVLRRCGAFYIRRSIGQDRLYWAILTEYVQTHLIHADRPVEFFVEGTRSRVGKSLHPKYGFIQMVLEPYLRGNVFDIVVVPVTTNYDKLLEEMPYSYELLGFPKPKESTSVEFEIMIAPMLGLLKARDFLHKKFGRCFVTFGDPISVRSHFEKSMSLPRSQVISQTEANFTLSERQRNEIKKFAHHVVRELDRNAIITIWSIACANITYRLALKPSSAIHFQETYLDVVDLLRLLQALDVTVHINENVDKDLRYYFDLHSNLFLAYDGELQKPDFHLKLKEFHVLEIGNVDRDIMEKSISNLVLATYANSMMHSIYDVGYVAAIVLGMKILEVNRLEVQYRNIQKLLEREFIYVPGEESASFHNALKRLEKAKIIEISDGLITVTKPADFGTLRNLIVSIIANFQIVLEALFSVNGQSFSNGGLIPTCQKFIAAAYKEGTSQNPVRLSFLSTEPIKNACSTLKVHRVLLATEDGRLTLDRSSASQILRDLTLITGSHFGASHAKL